ncbi:MAG: Fe-S cluster protein [Gemmatimonadales bacterium]|nr:Fe-S cluster protein [Gemmatimonadales bacterium]NIN10910.1 Fe-S cluster protein [Gemmatimonadales bacterium]NIN49508.1 Fe-S cluster protein [Gemmatimonadales bacterium]NIP06972.1 Fe-S cluster protein [Gemmatimonadales bacterium]NIQ99032.1 Fe-S cluster protein [Gemmatimonadales bacterium]
MSVATTLVSVLILGGVGFIFAALISLTHRKFRVWEDPRIDAVEQLLPGSNCGACGMPGCRGFAEALVGGKVQPANCTVLGPDEVVDVADYLGVEAGEANKRVARLLCAGGSNVAIQQADYVGLETCKAAAAVAGGGKGCTWGCVGLADCEVVCDFDAIYMNPWGLPVVIPDKCTACGDCVEACPKDLFVLMPVEHKLIVQCKNLLEGEEAEAWCQVACNACGRCAADAPEVIQMVDGLAVVDYSKHDLATPAAIERCPTGAIVWVEGAQQFERPQPMEKAVA